MLELFVARIPEVIAEHSGIYGVYCLATLIAGGWQAKIIFSRALYYTFETEHFSSRSGCRSRLTTLEDSAIMLAGIGSRGVLHGIIHKTPSEIDSSCS